MFVLMANCDFEFKKSFTLNHFENYAEANDH